MTFNDIPFGDLIGKTIHNYVIKDIEEVYATDENGNKLMVWYKNKEEDMDTGTKLTINGDNEE